MDPNPYEAPKEAGYRTPRQSALDAWAKDRLLLIVAGVACYAAMFGIVVIAVVIG
jgi:hypothetical protein